MSQLQNHTLQNPAKEISKKPSILSSDWILEQDPNAYTVQIVASPNKQNLLDFMKKNGLDENTAYYQKSSAEKIWYVLVHGAYSTRDQALEMIQQLPEAIKKNSPYIIQKQ